MNIVDRYNAIIDAIENMILNNPEAENKDIILEAFGRAKYIGEANSKIHRGIFLFLTEMTADNYISERRMMQAYKHLVSAEQWDCEGAYRITNLAQKSFIRKFEATFNMQPREAYKMKNMAFFKEPLYWDNLMSKGKDIVMQNGYSFSEDTKFGIPMNKYVLAQSAQNRQTYFGLNDLEANFAFKISEEKGYPIEDAFEYVYAYVWKYIEEPNYVNLEKRDRYLERDLGNRYVQYMYFTLGYDFSIIHDIIDYVKKEFDEGKAISYKQIKNLYDLVCRECEEEAKYYEEYNSSELEDEEYYLEEMPNYEKSSLDFNYDIDMDDPDIIDELFLDDGMENIIAAYEDEYWEKVCFDLNNLEDYEKCCEEAKKEMDSSIKSEKVLPYFYDDLYDLTDPLLE